MIVGDPVVFAIESGFEKAYEQLAFLALGFFVIHVSGRTYGKYAPGSTMLACSFQEVERRIAKRGKHTAPFAAEADGGQIADAFLNAFFAERQEESYFGIPLATFCEFFSISHNGCQWAPDGDEAFDDNSYVLQFDVEDRVRLIAFKHRTGCRHEYDTLSDLWLSDVDFYPILQHWHTLFKAEWAASEKARS